MQKREIICRGKRADNGEWVYGYYTLYGKSRGLHPAIITGTEEGCVIPAFIDLETRGECTTLTDRNGVRIFEGDIVKIYPDCDYLEDFEISKVYSYNGVLCVNYHTSEYDATAIGFAYDIDKTEFEVIGNIHDNPELVKD